MIADEISMTQITAKGGASSSDDSRLREIDPIQPVLRELETGQMEMGV